MIKNLIKCAYAHNMMIFKLLLSVLGGFGVLLKRELERG